MNRAATWIFSLLLLTVAGNVTGKIYKWTDENGRTHFSSSPPGTGKAEIVKPKINTYSSRKPKKSGAKPGTKKKVVMYSATWCVICKNARRYFKKNGITFKEYDIETSSKGRRDYKRLRGRGVPIIMIGNKRMNGFDPKSFKAMYGS